MKKLVCLMLINLVLTGGLFGVAFAQQETGHYVNGVEGIKAASLPGPGFYYRMYNAYYTSDTLMDGDGNELDWDFDVSVFANVHRFIWISDKKIAGANYVTDIIIPFVYTDIKVGIVGIDDDSFNLGDICFEPIALSWHGSRYDAAAGIGFYVPTGDYDKDKNASAGKDFWTTMLTLGGTYYFDMEKTWTLSILGRYEIHTEKKDTAVRPGNDFHFEWGAGKTIAEVWDVGLAGYCHWQVTDDSGSDVYWDKSVHDRVYAIGPEVGVFIPSHKFGITFRSLWEFNAKDRSEGDISVLNAVIIF